MKVVIDTNVLLISIPSRSKYRPIFDAFVNRKISFVVTTDIYLGYLEIFQNLGKKGLTNYFKDFLACAENVIAQTIYYKWNLITSDPDDNKFIDAYVAADADYLVTNDAHFNEIKRKVSRR